MEITRDQLREERAWLLDRERQLENTTRHVSETNLHGSIARKELANTRRFILGAELGELLDLEEEGLPVDKVYMGRLRERVWDAEAKALRLDPRQKYQPPRPPQASEL